MDFQDSSTDDPIVGYRLLHELKTYARILIMTRLYRTAFHFANKYGNVYTDIEDIFNAVNDSVATSLNRIYITIEQKKIFTALIIPFNTQFRTVLKAMGNISAEIPPLAILPCIHITFSGIVDYKKTAENLMEKEIPSMNNMVRYRIARIFCLDNDKIVNLWSSLDVNSRSRLKNWPVFGLGSPLSKLYRYHESERLCGKENDLMFAVLDVNEAAVRHFFSQGQQLCCARLQVYLQLQKWKPTFPFNCKAGVATFLLSQFPETVARNIKIVLQHRKHFLHMLFEWPYLDMFEKTLDSWNKFKSEYAFSLALNNICCGRLTKIHVRDPYFAPFKSLWEMVINNEDFDHSSYQELANQLVKDAFNDSAVSRKNCLRFVKFLIKSTRGWKKTYLINLAIVNIGKLKRRGLINRMIYLIKYCGLTLDERLEFLAEARRSHGVREVFRQLVRNGKRDLVDSFWDSLNCNFHQMRTMVGRTVGINRMRLVI